MTVRQFSRDHPNFLVHDFDQGEMVGILTGSRLFVMYDFAYREMVGILVKRFDSGGYVILQELGIATGIALAKRFKVMGATEMPNLISKLARLKGWGRLEVTPYVKTPPERVRLEMFNNVFAKSLTELIEGEKTCFILTGMFSGLWGEMYGNEYSATEDECINEGSDRCVFTVKRK